MARFRCAGFEARGVEAFMAAYSQLTQHGVWPVAGGLLDQSAAFVQAVQVADAERGLLERERMSTPQQGGVKGLPPAAFQAPQVDLPDAGPVTAPHRAPGG